MVKGPGRRTGRWKVVVKDNHDVVAFGSDARVRVVGVAHSVQKSAERALHMHGVSRMV